MSASHDDWKENEAARSREPDPRASKSMFDIENYAFNVLAGMNAQRVREVRCGACNGSGWAPVVYHDSMGEQGDRCVECGGVGRVWR